MMAELTSATSCKYALAKHSQRGMVPGCMLLSQELELTGNPLKEKQGNYWIDQKVRSGFFHKKTTTGKT